MTKTRDLSGIDYLRLARSIGLPGGSGIIEAGKIFDSPQKLLAALNRNKGMQRPDPYNRGKSITLPGVEMAAIYAMIDNGTLEPCKLANGEVLPTQAPYARPGTPLAELSPLQGDDPETGESVETEPAGHRFDVKWGYNPAALQGKDLNYLQSLIVAKDPNYFENNDPFDDAEEAAAWLSQDFDK